MADFIQILFEIIAHLILLLIHLAAGSVTIIAYAFSGRFREKKQREWKERPRGKYIDLGISSVCLGLLTLFVFWILLPESKSKSHGASSARVADTNGEFQLVIGGARSDQSASEVKITVTKDSIAKFMHKIRRSKSNTNEFRQNSAAKREPIVCFRYKFELGGG